MSARRVTVKPLITTVILEFIGERVESKPGRAFVVVELDLADARKVALYEETEMWVPS